MQLYDSIWIADWFQIHFIENNGMAFGMTFINKYVLTTFRLVAIIFIGWHIKFVYAKVVKIIRFPTAFSKKIAVKPHLLFVSDFITAHTRRLSAFLTS